MILKNISIIVNINSPYSATGSRAALPSTRSRISDITKNKLGCSTSLIQSGISCLSDVASLLPGLTWAGLEIHYYRKMLEVNGPDHQILKMSSTYPQETESPPSQIHASIKLTCGSSWPRSAVIGGISYNVSLNMYTVYDSWPLLQGENPTTETIARPLLPEYSKPTGICEHELVFDLHKEVMQSMGSEEYDDIQDLTQRLVLLTFLFSDNKPRIAPLTFVRFRTEIRHTLRKADLQPNPASTLKPGLSTATVEMVRSDYDQAKRFAHKKAQSSQNHSVYVALGSNVGDRLAMIELACNSLQARDIRVVRTSALYETAPMYLEDQPPFLNGACQVGSTTTTC